MRLLLATLIALLPFQTFAARVGTPFHPAVDERFDKLENDEIENPAIAKKYARVTYQPSVDGGDSASTNGLGVFLPAGALITDIIVYVNTNFDGVGGGTKGGSVALQCSGTRDLMEYHDMEAWATPKYLARMLGHAAAIGFGAGSLIAAQQTATIQGIGSSVSSRCEIKAVVRGDSGDEALSSGLLTAFIGYVDVD